uniref:Uncharacterized protein n=1 Tax=Lepeophtheirus salmonis TaxID=72036 RepID=A0A0K2T527_LEPSM
MYYLYLFVSSCFMNLYKFASLNGLFHLGEEGAKVAKPSIRKLKILHIISLHIVVNSLRAVHIIIVFEGQ